MELTKKQLGTLILALKCSLSYRDFIKADAKMLKIDHLNEINEEFRLLMKLNEELKNMK